MEYAIKGSRDAPQTVLASAFRYSIKTQIREFKLKAFQGVEHRKCPLTGDKITVVDCEVDHEEPQFQDIVLNFMNQYNRVKTWTPLLVDRVSGEDRSAVSFIDNRITRDFQSYHKSRARLRVTSKRGNNSRARGRKRDWSRLVNPMSRRDVVARPASAFEVSR